MWSAVTADSQPTDVAEYVSQLQLENATLRELLGAGRHSLVSPVCSQGSQTNTTLADDDEVNASALSCSEADTGSVVNSTVVENSRCEPAQAATAVPPQTDSCASYASPAAVSSASNIVSDSVAEQKTQIIHR